MEDEEGRGGLEGAGRLRQGKNRGEKEKISHKRRRQNTFKEKSSTRKMSSELQG